MVKNWHKSTSIRDIQIFIGFANFYWHFIQVFNRGFILLTSLLKITELSKLASKAFKIDDNEVVDDNGDKTNKTLVYLSKNKKFRNLMHMQNISAIRKTKFLNPNAKNSFN